MLTESIKPKIHKENEPKLDFNNMQDGIATKQHSLEDDTEMWDHEKLYKRISKKHQESIVIEDSKPNEIIKTEAKKDEKKEANEDNKIEAESKKEEEKKEEPPKEAAKV